MSSPATKIARMVRHDIGRKLTALVLAVGTWLLLEEIVIAEAEIPLDVRLVASELEARTQRAGTPALYVVVPDELIVRRVSAASVTVSVRGLKEELGRLRLSTIIPLTVDVLDASEEGRYVVDIDEPALYQSEGVESPLSNFSVRPPALTFELALRAETRVALGPENLVVTGLPRDGFEFDRARARVTPNEVTLSGPKTVIDAVVANPTVVKLEPIAVDGRIAEVKRQVGLDPTAVDESLELRTIGEQVTVSLPIVPTDVEIELSQVPVHYLNEQVLAERGQQVFRASETLDLRVVGPRALLADQDPLSLRSKIHLMFDWAEAPSLPQARERVKVMLELGSLSAELRVTGPAGDHPQIEYDLQPIGDDS